MKTTYSVLALVWFGVNALLAQVTPTKSAPAGATDGSMRYEAFQRDAHSRVWASVSYETNKLGEVSATTNTFVELQTGLHYRAGDQWLESEAKIEILPNNAGAAASKGQHKAIFPLEIKAGIIELQTPDNQWLRSRVWGLSYFDSATGASVLLAEVKASEGQLVGENTLIYPDAFTDCRALIRYTYTLAGFEQDVVFEEMPPPPEKFGLNPRSTRLQVLTEFVEAPSPTKERRQAGGLADESLVFGQMAIRAGKAFSVDAEGDPTGQVPVAKEWTRMDGRDFLIEEVPYEKVAEQLQKLPAAGEYEGASLQRRGKGANVIAGLKTILPRRYAKAAPKPGTKRMTKAAPKSAPGFVMDYLVLNSQPNATLKGDTTFYVSGTVNLSGTTKIEGGTVVKYTNTSTARINFTGPLVCESSAYRPAVFTSKDDNSVGETISGSNNNPVKSTLNKYLLNGGSQANSYKYLRFAYAGTGLEDPYLLDVWHCQLLNCTMGIYKDPGDILLRNVLFVGCSTCVKTSDYVYGEHLTVDGCARFANSKVSGGNIINSMFTAVTTLGSVTLSSSLNQGSSSGIYQTVGGGGHYLQDNAFRNIGTTSINPTLLADLKNKTTYPPVVLTAHFTANTTLSPQAPRDTAAPDYGYHYDPLDYCWTSLVLSNATLTLANGVAIGNYGIKGTWLRNGAQFISEGKPTALNRLVRYTAVQEGVWGTTSTTMSLLNVTEMPAVLPKVQLWFTDISLPADATGKRLILDNNNDYGIDRLVLKDCQVRGGALSMSFYPNGDSRIMTLGLTNNLIQRASLNVNQDTSIPGRLVVHLRNNLVLGGALAVNDYTGTGTWTAYDNLFDQAAGSLGSVLHDYNGYTTGTTVLSAPHNKPNLAADYQPGPAANWFGVLGNYYYPTSGQNNLYELINASIRTPAQAGLHHYTVKAAANSKEGTDPVQNVDIGFHYVAVDGNGHPIDTDTDGLADYFEDTNGNGSYDTGDLADLGAPDTDNDGMPDGWEWNHFDTFSRDGTGDYDSDGVTDLDEYTVGSDPNTILFDVQFANLRVNSNTVSGVFAAFKGVPDKMAVLMDNTNFASATWFPYNSNLTVNAGSTDGPHEAWIGLKGRATTSEATWSAWPLTRDTVSPVIVITNPVVTTVSQPILQLQGYSAEPLLSLRYDVTNAAGTLTNAEGYVTTQWFDTNVFEVTTNWFECVDIQLIDGDNTITLRATDLAGNVATNVYTYVLDYTGDTTAPALTVYWPQDGTKVSGTSFTLRGWIDDATASVTAQIVDANDVTNVVSGLLERGGLLWVEDLPLGAGANTLTLTMTDATNNVSTTNLTVIQSDVVLAIHPVSGAEVNQPRIIVSGTINGSGHKIWVNGMEVTNVSGEDWWVEGVPVNPGGTAVIQAVAIPNTDNGSGGNGGSGATMQDPGNPTSPNAKTVEGAPDKDPEVVLIHYRKDWTFDSAEREAPHVTHHETEHIQWKFNQPGSWTTTECFGSPDDGTYYYGWTDKFWGGNGVGTLSGNTSSTHEEGGGCGVKIPSGDSSYTAPTWWRGESCTGRDHRVTSNSSQLFDETVSRKARTHYELHTGGKKVSGRKDLFVLTAWATGDANLFYPEKDEYPDSYLIWPTSIQLGSLGKLGSDERLYKALGRGETHNVTPLVAGSRYYRYSQPGASKHKPYITANGEPLAPDKVNVTNCVGQKIVFALQFDPAWPAGVQATDYDWVLSPKYVNAWEEYSGMEWNSYWMHVCHPATNWFSRAWDQGTAPGTPYCKFYQTIAWPLKQSETGAWWVSGGNKLARLFSELTFANGQKASLITEGRFQIHRPTFKNFTDVNPSFPNSGRSFLWNGDVLSYGDSGSGEHGLYWEVEVDANFSGDLGILQLVNAQYTQNHGWCPACRDTLDTHGEYWLDGSVENYEQKAYEIQNPSSHNIIMNDHPAEELWLASPINVRMWGQFKDYLRFRPSGADSIFVTLGKNNWSMEGKATVTSGITINSTPAPSALVESDEFPVWIRVKLE